MHLANRTQRKAWQRGTERDLDAVNMDLLHTRPHFREWLLRRVLPHDSVTEPPAFIGAWHSVNTPNGESDMADVAKSNLAAILHQHGVTNVRSL